MPHYKQRMIRVSRMLLDRIVHPLDECVHRLRAVLRRNGRQFDVIKAVDLWLFQTYHMDLFLIMIVSYIVFVTVLR
jgi:hypothetical protein